nr:hypothetical protein [uncultured bacterium]
MSFAPRALPQLRPDTLAARLSSAHVRRRELAASNDCYRVHDLGEAEVPGLTVERFGDFAVVHDYAASQRAHLLAVGAALLELGAKGVYLKERVRGGARKRGGARSEEPPLLGEAAPKELEVHESGRRYWVRLAEGLATGLFVDQRENRTRLQESAADRSVLNLFCYTGSFSVAAGLGGARKVTSIDNSRAALARLNANLRLNLLDPAGHRVLRADAVQFLSRAARGAERFDVIVLDPPTFSSDGESAFSVRAQYETMAKDCFGLLTNGGRLLAVTNDRGTSELEFRRMVERAARSAGRELESLWKPPPPLDCPLGEDASTATKSLWARVR